MGKNDDTSAVVNVARAAKEIAVMSTGKAEKALENIADRDGDELAAKILTHLPPVKIASILRQHDFSCPSTISWIMTPELIVEVLKIDPLFWKDVYDRNDTANFFEIQSNALDLVISLLLNAKDISRQEKILRELNDDELGRLYILLPFVGWEIKENQMLEFEDPEIDPGTADHLHEIIRWAAPYVSRQILDLVYSAETSLVDYIMDLWLNAFRRLEKGHDIASLENIMFLPLH